LPRLDGDNARMLGRPRGRAAATQAGTAWRARGARMGKRLYVGNLPYQCDEDQLRALFEQDGRQVEEVKIVTDRETGRPRGFAFIEMATDAQAQAAVNALHGKPFGGRPLTVSEARERAPGGGGGGGGGRGGMGRRDR